MEKTTTSFMLDTIYRLAGYKTGIIGTVYTKYADVMVPSILTTPESYDLQRYLSDMVENKIKKLLWKFLLQLKSYIEIKI